MIDPGRLYAVLLGALSLPKPLRLTKLAGDAGNRTYYRLTWNTPPSSLILMVLADPEEFKQSEEAVSGPFSEVTELPFLNIQRHLRACHVAVPEIFHYDKLDGWLFLEDLGEVTLAEVVSRSPTEKSAYYKKAIDTLIALQREATPKSHPPVVAHLRSFDQPLFLWELDHFIEYGIEKRNGAAIREIDKEKIRFYFSEMAMRLASLPKVFTHRDYHSRNLMIQEDTNGIKIRVIDFQDALMGPCQYDLASLLRDSYIALPEGMVADLIDYYLHKTGVEGDEATELFREDFDQISIQRNLKAVGRFIYIDCVKKNPAFLQYVSPTLIKVKQNLTKHRALTPLHALLAPYIKEFQ